MRTGGLPLGWRSARKRPAAAPISVQGTLALAVMPLSSMSLTAAMTGFSRAIRSTSAVSPT
jgi:hypothetical protein